MGRKKTNCIQLTVHLPEAVAESVQAMAAEQERSVGSVVVLLVKKALRAQGVDV